MYVSDESKSVFKCVSCFTFQRHSQTASNFFVEEQIKIKLDLKKYILNKVALLKVDTIYKIILMIIRLKAF